MHSRPIIRTALFVLIAALLLAGTAFPAGDKRKNSRIIRLSGLDEESTRRLEKAVEWLNETWKSLGKMSADGTPFTHKVYDKNQHRFVQKDLPETDRRILAEIAANWSLSYQKGKDTLLLKTAPDNVRRHGVVQEYALGLNTGMIRAAQIFLPTVRAIERSHGADFLQVYLPKSLTKKLGVNKEAQNTLFIFRRKKNIDIKTLKEKIKAVNDKLEDSEKDEKKVIDKNPSAVALRLALEAEKQTLSRQRSDYEADIKRRDGKDHARYSAARYSEYGLGLVLFHELIHKHQLSRSNNAALYGLRYGMRYIINGGYYNVPAERQAYRLEDLAASKCVPKDYPRPKVFTEHTNGTTKKKRQNKGKKK